MSDAALADDLSGLATLLSPEHRADPYPLYARLRRTRPVWRPAERLVVLSRHRDCAAVLRDPRFGHPDDGELPRRRFRSIAGGSAPSTGLRPQDDRSPVRSFLALNPPHHTRLRRLVARSFTPRRVDALEPLIEEVATNLVHATRERERVDVVESLAGPLPVRVICDLFGVRAEDRARLVRWSHALARSLDPPFLVGDEERSAQVRARDEFAAFLVGLAGERRRSPADDLVSDLVAVRDGPGPREEGLTESELVATCVLLLVAGHETTTSLIANGLLALVRHPAQLDRLRREPGLVPNAVEELLRFDPPVQLTMRTALGDAEAGGLPVQKGSAVLLLLASANRDPEAHRDPDVLDVARPPCAHLAFGHGVHFCLGAPLARLETQVALRTLLGDVDGLELAAAPSWKENAVLRGVRRLDVRLVRGPGRSRATAATGTDAARGGGG
jgi:cytochrome P450